MTTWLSSQSFVEGKRSFWGATSRVLAGLLNLVAGGLIGAALTTKDPLWLWVWGCGLGLVGLILGLRGEVLHARRLERIQKQTATELKVFINPLARAHEALSTLLVSDESEADLNTYFKAIAEAGADVFPGDGHRVCIYELDSQEVRPGATAETVKMLSLRTHGGRPDHPRAHFRDDTPHGRRFINAAMGQYPHCVPDAAQPATDVDRKTNTPWVSFMIVPVLHNSVHYGAIAIDSEERTEYSETHKKVGQMISSLVAIGERIARQGGADVIPEIDQARRELEKLNLWDELADRNG